MRYDATQAPGQTARSVTLSLNYRPADRARLTLEGVFGGGSATLNAAALFAF